MNKILVQELALYLREFLTKHSLNSKEFAKSIGISCQELNEILTEERLPTEAEYAEILIAMTIIEAKGWHYWLSMSSEKKSELAAKFVATGGSTMTIGAIIALISACGFPGLSAAGITSGLATIGALVGGSMVAGIAVCSTAPLVVGGVLYAACKSGKKPLNYLRRKFSVQSKVKESGKFL